jgi:hypothetical protein
MIGQHFHFGPAHHLLGLALWKLGKTDEAFESLKKAVEVNPVFPLGHHSLSRFYRLVRRDAAASRRHRHLAREARQHASRFTGAAAGPEHPEEIREMFREREGDDTWAPSKAPLPLPRRAETVMVVTGLPRSGTSMMMQMLAAGGWMPLPTIIARPTRATSVATSSTSSPVGWPSMDRGWRRPAGRL